MARNETNTQAEARLKIDERLKKVLAYPLPRDAEAIVAAHAAKIGGKDAEAAKKSSAIIAAIEAGTLHLPGTDWHEPKKEAATAV